MPAPVRHARATRSARPRPSPAEFAPGLLDYKAVELAQRGRMILDVAEADLEVAEHALGPFDETTWYFRRALAEARTSWDRLRARYGLAALEAALDEPPATVLTLGRSADAHDPAVLVVIGGQTYGVRRLPDTVDAPRVWRLDRLPPGGDGPYHACRLADDSTQCDCAEWTYQIADLSDDYCKHLAALDALGWL